ncbi:13229_t:CDS:1, partial [Cetraspora pellucida]
MEPFEEHAPDEFELDVDIQTYFEESFRTCKDLDGLSNTLEPVMLQKEDTFVNYKEAESHMRHFAEYNSFKVHLGHLMTKNNEGGKKIIHKQTILYKHSGLYELKNPEKPNSSSRIICLWHVKLSHPLKNNPSFYVFVTIFNNSHNYDLSPEALQFEKKKQFTNEMQKEIKFLVFKCHLGTTMIRCILKEKFLLHLIFSKDLSSEIQRYRLSSNAIKRDAANLYEQLQSKKYKNPHWFIEAMWEEESNALISLFWMSPEQIFLWCKFGEAI